PTDLAPAPENPLDPALESKLDATLSHLRDLHRTAVLAHALQVGKYLLDTFFAGDPARFHDRTPDHVGFEALLEYRAEALADLGLSSTTLRNTIRAWEVWSDLPPQVREALSLSHLVRLAAVDVITRSRMAFDAATGRWGVRRLDQAIEAWREDLRGGHRLGRPPLPEPVKAWGHVFTATRQARELAGSLADLAPKHRAQLQQELEAAVVELQAALKALRAAKGPSA
ncbi:MAG: hypothetical protein ACOYOB_18120, partial [Myxococcota bacterium]